MSALAVYEFSCKGKTPDGNTARFVGEVTDLWSDRFPPHSAGEKARAEVERLAPGFIFDGDVVVDGQLKVKQFPSLRMLKGKTKALHKKTGVVPVMNP